MYKLTVGQHSSWRDVVAFWNQTWIYWGTQAVET